MDQPARAPELAGGRARLDRFVPAGQGDLAPSGAKARVEANLEALRTLRTLQAEDRPATAEERSRLARWGSWGAQGVWQIFDEDRPEHAAQRQELKELLTEREYLAAKRTTINAHYTDAAYAQAVWGTLARLGFTEGEVLEPGAGAGTFIGLAPEGAGVSGVELGLVTGGSGH